MKEQIKIALVDDHVLLREGLADLIKKLQYEVVFQADNGLDLLKRIEEGKLPDIVIMDINMPEMDGYATTGWLKKNYPDIKVLALSMYDNETSIIRMLKNGARGYILKDVEPKQLKAAIESLCINGFHYSEKVTGSLLHNIQNTAEEGAFSFFDLNEREIEFLKLAATEMTYKEIADCMCCSPRTVDGYREQLFAKLSVKNRIGLVLFAIRNGIVQA